MNDNEVDMLLDNLGGVLYSMFYKETNNRRIYHLIDNQDLEGPMHSGNNVIYRAAKIKRSICNHYKWTPLYHMKSLQLHLVIEKLKDECSIVGDQFQNNKVCKYCHNIILKNPDRYGFKYVGRTRILYGRIPGGTAHTYEVDKTKVLFYDKYK
jgi:hypothetical protein